MFLFKGFKSFLSFKTGVGLNFNLVTDVPDSLLGYINLLGNLHKSGKRVIKINTYMNEHVP